MCNFKEIHRCEVCDSATLKPVLDLGNHPLCDDLVEIGNARACQEYPIEVLFCQTCKTAHQRIQVSKLDLFPPSYHYRARFTADVLKGMAGLVGSCSEHLGSLAGKTVLDIGCNDGSLLDYFRSHGAITVGLEPTDAHLDAKGKGHNIFNAFLDERSAHSIVAAHGIPDVITFTNVFAHVDDLDQAIRSLRLLLKPNTVVIIENHYLGSVLDGGQFDTFYHEHPRTYSYASFTRIAERLGISVMETEFPSRYVGNIRVYLGDANLHRANFNGKSSTEMEAREANFHLNFAQLQEGVYRWRAEKRRLINQLVERHGSLRAKAFPGRAAIAVKLLGLDASLISAVYEKAGSKKIGHYVPGTRIPIASDEDLFALADKSLPILNFAWHIPQEIRKYLLTNDYRGEVIDILSSSDITELST